MVNYYKPKYLYLKRSLIERRFVCTLTGFLRTLLGGVAYCNNRTLYLKKRQDSNLYDSRIPRNNL